MYLEFNLCMLTEEFIHILLPHVIIVKGCYMYHLSMLCCLQRENPMINKHSYVL